MFSCTDIQFERREHFAISGGGIRAGEPWYFSCIPSSLCLCWFCVPPRYRSSTFWNCCPFRRISHHQPDLSVLWWSVHRR
jgi:hypothetical protein